MDFLGLGTPCFLDRGEIGIGFQFQHIQCAHLVGTAAAVAAAAPAVMLGFGITGIFRLFRLGAAGGLLLVEALEIIPSSVVFARVLLAEIPPVRAVGRFGRRTITRLVTSVPVADTYLCRIPASLIAPPARKTPVVRAARARHQFNPFVIIR